MAEEKKRSDLKFSDFEKQSSVDDLYKADYDALSQEQRLIVHIVTDLLKVTAESQVIGVMELAELIELIGKMLRHARNNLNGAK